jgi:hypothetical protein
MENAWLVTLAAESVLEQENLNAQVAGLTETESSLKPEKLEIIK